MVIKNQYGMELLPCRIDFFCKLRSLHKTVVEITANEEDMLTYSESSMENFDKIV